MSRTAWFPAALAALLACAAPAAGAPLVTAVELVAPAPLPEPLVRTALLPMAGRPRSLDVIRASLERLWALEIFSAVRVEEVAEAGGVRLRVHLTRKPWVERIAWEGDTGIRRAELAAGVALPLGGDAGQERLERARRELLELLRRQGYFGAEARVTADTDPATQATRVTFAVRAGSRARIALHIQGLDRFPAGRFRRALDLAGQRYSEAKVREGVRAAEERMRKAGFFEASVRAGPPAWDAATNRVALGVSVAEGPEYRLEFAGDRKVREGVLRDALPFAATGIVDELALESAERLLREAYRERGYHFAEVHARLEPDGPVRTIRIRLAPGPRVKVADVAFDGNRAVTADRLRSVIQTRRDTLLTSGYFQETILQRDLRVLLAFYRSQGMDQARVGPPDVSFSEDRGTVRIRIPIEEGAVTQVGAIGIEGASAIPAEDIRAALPVRPGTAWSGPLTEEIRRAVSALYAAKGYAAAEIAVQEQAREGLVDLTVRVQEGELTRMGRLQVSGLVRTQEAVVQREFPLDPGDAFDPEALVKTEQRLADLGIFERIELTPLRPPPTPFTDVAVRVQEAKAWRLDLGAGYSTDDGPRASLELGHDNVFGTARRASIRQKISRIEDRTDLTYQQPWTLGTRWGLTGNLFRERREEIGFDVERVGAAAEIQKALLDETQKKLRAALRYQVQWVERSNVDPALIEERVEPGGQIVASLRPSLTWDLRNDPLNPTRGSLHFLALEGAGLPLGSEVTYVKTEATTSWLFDAVGPTVLALSARLGLAQPFGQSEELPIEERFFAGGESTIRGYARNRVGPLDEADHPRGGNARILLNAEWRFPIWRFITGALFVDTGSVEAEIGDLRVSKFKTGVGSGLRLVTPVGPLRFDVGYGLNPVHGDDDRLAFYFSVGYPF